MRDRQPPRTCTVAEEELCSSWLIGVLSQLEPNLCSRDIDETDNVTTRPDRNPKTKHAYQEDDTAILHLSSIHGQEPSVSGCVRHGRQIQPTGLLEYARFIS